MAFSVFKFRVYVGVAVFILYLAQIFVIVGLATNFWLEIRDRNVHKDDVEMHFGLHRVCWSKSDRCNNPNSNYDKKNFLPVIQGLVITGAVFGLAACLVSLVNFFREMLELRLKYTTIASISLAFVSGIILMIGCALFGEKIEIDRSYGVEFEPDVYKGYSFGLTTCAGGLMWVAAILTSLATFCGKEDEETAMSKKPPPYTPGPPSVIMSTHSYSSKPYVH